MASPAGVVTTWFYVSKHRSALHTSVAADVCLASRLVHAISCSLFGFFHYGEKFVVLGRKLPQVIVSMTFFLFFRVK